MGALDPAKIFVVLVIALIVLGPERMPRVARQLGGIWRELSKVREQVVSEIHEAIPSGLPESLPHIPRPTPGAVSGFVTGLMTGNTTASKSSASSEVDQAEQSDKDDNDQAGLQVPMAAVEPSLVVVHPEFGDFAFLPDDPSMN